MELSIHTLKGHKASVMSVVVSPDGNYIVSGSVDKKIKVWELGTGRLVRTLRGHKRHVFSVAVSPDGNYIVSGSLDKMVKVWELLEIKEK